MRAESLANDENGYRQFFQDPKRGRFHCVPRADYLQPKFQPQFRSLGPWLISSGLDCSILHIVMTGRCKGDTCPSSGSSSASLNEEAGNLNLRLYVEVRLSQAASLDCSPCLQGQPLVLVSVKRLQASSIFLRRPLGFRVRSLQRVLSICSEQTAVYTETYLL